MLTSLQNPLAKQIRKLHQAKHRRQQKLFLLEGTHLLEAALEAGAPLQTICCTPDWQSAHPQLWQALSQHVQRAELVSAELLRSLATTVEPNGAIATVQRQPSALNTLPDIRLGFAVETLQDPGNLGTIIRTAAAAAVEGIWVSTDSVDLDHPKVLRASAGAWFRVPMAASRSLETVVSGYRDRGFQIMATLPTAQTTYWHADLTQPTIVLLGNEGAGLSKNLIALATEQVSIPLAAGVESLNVSIAAALIAYEVQRQRQMQALANST